MNFQILQQIQNAKNPKLALQNLISSNPQMAQAWKVVQDIQSKGSSKEEMLKMACQQSGMNYESVKKSLSSFGINI